MLREQWILGGLHIDYFSPGALHPELDTAYESLLYCCATSNAAKRDLELPDPTPAFLAESIRVLTDRSIEASAPAAACVIQLLGLNTPKYREFRLMWIEVQARLSKPELYRQLLNFPDDLPDLSTLLPPGGNTRSAGVAASYLSQQKNGTLPETY